MNYPELGHGKEDNTPGWHERVSSIDLSSIKSWADVAKSSVVHYAPGTPLPNDFKLKLEKIRKQTSDPKRVIAELLALVQNEIRYVGIEIGRGAFIPRAPAKVIERRYGDCKDKAFVMIAALRELGFDAVPVLAHLEKGEMLNTRLPSPYAFNHVFVRVKNEEDVYWLDPTGTQQYSPDPKNSQVNYGYVLPIEPESTDRNCSPPCQTV